MQNEFYIIKTKFRGGVSLNSDQFIYTLFLIDIIQKANSDGFKFIVNGKDLTVYYPLQGPTNSVTISDMEQFRLLCKDILTKK